MVFHSHLEELLEGFREEVLSSYSLQHLAKAFERISERYRKETGLFLQTEEEKAAYMLTRLPATFAAVFSVFKELLARAPHLKIESILDAGAGPGTALWAAAESFKSLEKATLIEKDAKFASLGQKLMKRSSLPLFSKAQWNLADLTELKQVEKHDLTVLSYSIGELKESTRPRLLKLLWEQTDQALVLIEPGTPNGYGRMMKIREYFLKELGAFLWGPCPHSNACPLLKGDWCHFSARVQRSSLHRQLKSAELGHEDEKFFYLIFGKRAEEKSFSQRILRHPIKHSGFFELTLCGREGVQKKIYSKRDQEKYREIKKLNWGDVIY
jgi:ribosomal protein RSM22 (predicted rRNA methylase)